MISGEGAKTTGARGKIQFGWVWPTGARAGDDKSQFDIGVRRALATVTGQWDSAWVTDHLQWDDSDRLEAMSTLTFYAALTPQLDWGTMVLCQSYRNPAYMAKLASTIQFLTQGRFIMGIGAGWKQDEYLAYDYDFPSAAIRIEQLEDTLNILKRMWTQPRAIYAGKHYQIRDAINLPQWPRPPILMVGGRGEKKMLPLVARCADWWNTNCSTEEFVRKVDILKRECAQVGRDFSTLRLTWFGGVGIGTTPAEIERRTRDAFARHKGMCGTPNQIGQRIQELVDLGCTYFMFDTRGLPEPGELELLIELGKRWR